MSASGAAGAARRRLRGARGRFREFALLFFLSLSLWCGIRQGVVREKREGVGRILLGGIFIWVCLGKVRTEADVAAYPYRTPAAAATRSTIRRLREIAEV